MAQADKIGQALQLMSVLGNNVHWNVVDPSDIQYIIDRPKEAGVAFELFLIELAGVRKHMNAVPDLRNILQLPKGTLVVRGKSCPDGKKTEFSDWDVVLQAWRLAIGGGWSDQIESKAEILAHVINAYHWRGYFEGFATK